MKSTTLWAWFRKSSGSKGLNSEEVSAEQSRLPISAFDWIEDENKKFESASRRPGRRCKMAWGIEGLLNGVGMWQQVRTKIKRKNWALGNLLNGGNILAVFLGVLRFSSQKHRPVKLTRDDRVVVRWS